MIWTITVVLTLLFFRQDNPMERAGQTAELFLKQFPAVQCVENIVQTKLSADGEAASTHSSKFDYVAFLKPKGRGLAVEESRVAQGRAASGLRKELLLTSGFPTMLVLFHPDFQDRFEFDVPLAPNPDGLTAVHFKSRPNARSISALKLKDRIYPILWTGVAWLNANTGAIARIEAGLSAPMEDLGLSELHADVEYAPVVFDGTSWWLPKRAVISVKTPHQAWRNVHEFSDYRMFSVTTTTRQNQSK
jgi:hypothetical protein